MSASSKTPFIVLTIVLIIGLTGVVGAAYRTNIAANWEENRCDPYVVPMAGSFKPDDDKRTRAQFAADNWSFCQKEYVQNAISVAAIVPKELASAEAAAVDLVQDLASVAGDVFFDLWNFCYQTYSTFMDKMKGVAKLFHNFLINLRAIVDRLTASALAIIFALISTITAFVNSIRTGIIVAIIVIGIILIMQILLFFVLLPISGMIIAVTALVAVVVVSVASALAHELFTPGACFAKGTLVCMAGDGRKEIESIKVGDVLSDGGRVTATHMFRTKDILYNLRGIRVTGDHLVFHSTHMIPVREHPEASPAISWKQENDLWCLTTTTRRIPCLGVSFADWEEIEDGDKARQVAWYHEVWTTLNGSAEPEGPSWRFLAAEAGLSPDCMVICRDWRGRQSEIPIRDIKIGQRVADGPTSTTKVIGKVRLAGDQATDAVELYPGQLVTCSSWVFNPIANRWNPATGPVRELHPTWWEHLYTESGSFTIRGNVNMRDASDVGLNGLRSLVESVVLSGPSPGLTI